MTIEHTPGPWLNDGAVRIQGNADGHRYDIAHPLRLPPHIFDGTASAYNNAILIALAPTAPHECDDPECPGNVNRRKLEAFDGLLTQFERISLIDQRGILAEDDDESVAIRWSILQEIIGVATAAIAKADKAERDGE